MLKKLIPTVLIYVAFICVTLTCYAKSEVKYISPETFGAAVSSLVVKFDGPPGGILPSSFTIGNEMEL